MLNNLGLLIKTLRFSAGLTQKEFADKLGTTHSAVSKWETNQNYPDVALLPRIASVLNISCDELLNPDETLRKLHALPDAPTIEVNETSEPSIVAEAKEVPVRHKQAYQFKWLFVLLVPVILIAAFFLLKPKPSNSLLTSNKQFEYVESRTNVDTSFGPAYEIVYYQDEDFSHDTYTKYADELAMEWREGAFKDSTENVLIVSYYNSGDNIDNWHDVYCRCFYLNNPPQEP